MDPPNLHDLRLYTGTLASLPVDSYVSTGEDGACVWQVEEHSDGKTKLRIVRRNTEEDIDEPLPLGHTAEYASDFRSFTRALLPDQSPPAAKSESDAQELLPTPPEHLHDFDGDLSTLPIGAFVSTGSEQACVWEVVNKEEKQVLLRIVTPATRKDAVAAGQTQWFTVGSDKLFRRATTADGRPVEPSLTAVRPVKEKGERMAKRIKFADNEDERCGHENAWDWECERVKDHDGPHMLTPGKYEGDDVAPCYIWDEDGDSIDDEVDYERHPLHGELLLIGHDSGYDACDHEGPDWYCELEEGHTGPHAVRARIADENRFWDSDGDLLDEPFQAIAAVPASAFSTPALTPEELSPGSFGGGCTSQTFDNQGRPWYCERTEGHDGPHMIRPMWREHERRVDSEAPMAWNDEGKPVESQTDMIVEPDKVTTVPELDEVVWYDLGKGNYCGAPNGEGLVCERVKGHEGPHMLPPRYANRTTKLTWNNEGRAVFTPVGMRTDDPGKFSIDMHGFTKFKAQGIVDGTLPEVDMDDGEERTTIYRGLVGDDTNGEP